ncbi:MAG: cytochrome c [bacterium]|nr:cytochrome c [bacterium]
MKHRIALFLGVFALAVTVAAEKKAPPWEKPLRLGRYVYFEHCTVCHEINRTESKKIGPTMFRFFQNEKTPLSGFPPTEAYFRIRVRFGGEVMPQYKDKLTEREMDALVAYVRSMK